MSDSIFQFSLYLIAAAVFGGVVAWIVRGARDKRAIEQLNDDWTKKSADAIRLRDRSTAKVSGLQTTIEAQQAIVRQHELTIANSRTDLELAQDEAKSMSEELFELRAERRDFDDETATIQVALVAAEKQCAELEEEFIKSGEVYKRELTKAFEKRKSLEVEVENTQIDLQAIRMNQKAVDDLQEIVGIGKVFEHTLHDLGIFTFQQIANFGEADIERVNSELSEFRGRMEQDDWIGQASELHIKKYGGTDEF
jgi:predicted flap endonuclease-1-like 5' DNA nuclease